MLRWLCGRLTSKPVGQLAEELGLRKLKRDKDRLVLRAAVLFGFYFRCRASEYLCSGRPDYDKVARGLDMALRWSQQRRERWPERLDVQFRKTKTDQLAFGCARTHYRVDGAGQAICVVRAMRELRRAFPEHFDGGGEAWRPVFRWAAAGLVRREEIQKILEAAAEAVGLPRSRFRSHSLRIGGASAMLHGTRQFDLVKRFGRWSSDAVHVYPHDNAEQTRGLAAPVARDKSAVHYP